MTQGVSARRPGAQDKIAQQKTKTKIQTKRRKKDLILSLTKRDDHTGEYCHDFLAASKKLGSISVVLLCLVYVPPREQRLDAQAPNHVCDVIL